MKARRWTEAEVAQLQERWGRYNLDTIAKRLKRSENSVVEKARRLGLPSRRPDAMTMNAFMAKTGYSLSRIYTAVAELGLCLHPIARTDPRQTLRNRYRKALPLAITEEQQEAIIDFLRKVPDATRLYKKTGKRTARGVWGIGVKPPSCLGCGRSDKPHYARGRCQTCYMRPFQKAWRKKQKRGG